MRKLSLAAAILLLSSAWVLAQRPDTQNPTSSAPSASQAGQQPQTSAGGQTVAGCVSGSAGNFTLTDASGTTYQLAGDTSKLADHVGHQVQITGDQVGGAGAPSSAASSGAAAAGAAGGSNTINVKKVKMISSSCPSK